MQPCGAVEAVDISGNRGAHLQDIGLSPQMAQSAFLQLPGEMIFYYNFVVVLHARNRFVVITEKNLCLRSRGSTLPTAGRASRNISSAAESSTNALILSARRQRRTDGLG